MWGQRCGMHKSGLWEKCSQNLSKVLEEPDEALQPDAFYIDVLQGLPLITKGTAVGRVHKPDQVHTCAHGSKEELPSNFPGGPWNQSGVQAGPLGFFAFIRWQQVPSLVSGLDIRVRKWMV